jgi:hypothetical protein
MGKLKHKEIRLRRCLGMCRAIQRLQTIQRQSKEDASEEVHAHSGHDRCQPHRKERGEHASSRLGSVEPHRKAKQRRRLTMQESANLIDG